MSPQHANLIQVELTMSSSLASPLPVTRSSPGNIYFLILPLCQPYHRGDRPQAGQGEGSGDQGERRLGCPGHAPLLAPILFFIGLEKSAAQPTGQFASSQGSSGRLLQCQRCAEGCTSCIDATPCLVEEALALRAALLACQACCMLAVFLSMLVSYRCRRSKARKAPHLSPAHPPYLGSLASTRDQRLPKTRTQKKWVLVFILNLTHHVTLGK